MQEKKIIIRGARQHNLQNVNLDIPRNKIIAFTGVSGSGKSSLAFDTLYAEGQRRYVESLSAYARQFLGQMERPEVDFIEGLSPSISIEQKTVSRNPRSTVATMTDRNFFEFTFKSPKRKTPIQIDGNLDDWNERSVVPDLMHMRGAKPFAQVCFSWDDDNLYIGLNVAGRKKPVDVDTRSLWRKDCMEVWIDLRNDKTLRRYNEHCHHFFFLPKGRKGNKELATACEWKEPGRPIQETIFDHEEIEIASIVKRREYSLEVRIPKSVIPTYDPIEHPSSGSTTT